MEFSTAGSGQMTIPGFEPNGAELYGFQQLPANPNPNPNAGHAGWQADGFSIRHVPIAGSRQEQLFMDGGRLLQLQHQQQQPPFLMKRAKYLIPAQELLNEFCDLGVILSSGNNTAASSKKKELHKWEDLGGPSNSPCSMDPVELRRREATLLSMLEEVYRRYRRYCEQMRAVVSTFETVAGAGSAMVYSTLASKAMSRHFRCLKDGVMGQIQATKVAMGERDAIAPGTKGETPRLKKLEQCLRQQKAFQQAGIMESQPWRPQRGLPERSVSVLRAWLFGHFLHPYPSDVDKHILARQTGLSRSQVSNWFINARVRLWKPMVEEMYTEELKEEEKSNPNPNIASSSVQLLAAAADEQKPVPGLLVNDSDSLSSIVNNANYNSPSPNPHPSFGVVGQLDFSSYNGRSGVSLTLGLQHHSLMFSRERINDGRPVQFSILDEEQGHNLPYRNLMGAQLLHDLAG